MTKTRIFLAMGLLLAAVATWYIFFADAPQTEVIVITPQEADARRRSDSSVVLLDVRSPEEYAEESIPGSILVNLNPPATFLERARPLLPDKNVPIFAFCRSGQRSQSAAEYLLSDGYREVYNAGGITDWPAASVKKR